MEFEYVYWDGSPHPRDLVVKKGDTIEIFLQRCRQQLRIDFIEMKSQAVDQVFAKILKTVFYVIFLDDVYQS